MHRRRIDLMAILMLLIAASCGLEAQTPSVLHNFAPGAFQHPGLILTNSDGSNPTGWLAASGPTLYGTAKNGGTTGSGTIFSITTNGSDFSVLYTFSSDLSVNTDGANPNGGMTFLSGTLFGTTSVGGSNDQGVVFAFDTSGQILQNLHTFTAVDPFTGANNDGANPAAGLLLAGGTLFGTAAFGGTDGNGVIFSVGTNGQNFRVLYQFTALDPTTETNSDGAFPSARLVLAGTTLFGTARAGGNTGYGTVFAVETDGSGFTVLRHSDTNDSNPMAELALSGDTLYGIAGSVVFSLHTNGLGFTILHQFSDRIDLSSTALPGLTLSTNTLFGAAAGDGTFGNGEVFSMSVNGAGFNPQHDFSAESPTFPNTNSDGAFPNGGLVLLDGTLYGTTGEGGASGNGVVFGLVPLATVVLTPPELSVQLASGAVVLSFQTVSGQNYSIQQNSDLGTTNWTAYTNILGSGASAQLTIPFNGAQLFFRALVQ